MKAAAAVSIVPRNVVITGANKGLGMELCKQLLARMGDDDDDVVGTAGSTGSSSNNNNNSYSTIYALCRKSSHGLAALAETYPSSKLKIVEGIDMTQDDTPMKLREIFHTTAVSSGGDDDDADGDDHPTMAPIHLLIHNAGAYGPPQPSDDPDDMYRSQSLETITSATMRYAFELNTVGVLSITQALLPNLKLASSSSSSSLPAAGGTTTDDDVPSSKLVIISSAMGSIAENTSGNHYAYRTAKAAVNMVGKTLSIDLKHNNIAVGLVHRGFILTNFGGENQVARPGQRSVQDGAKGVLDAIEMLTLESTGTFLHGNYGEGVKPIPW